MYNCVLQPTECAAKWLSECAIAECLSTVALRKLNDFRCKQCDFYECIDYLQCVIDSFSIFELISDEDYERIYLRLFMFGKAIWRDSLFEKLEEDFKNLTVRFVQSRSDEDEKES